MWLLVQSPAMAPARRTQAERRAETRAALLEATIACLAEYGYANTSTQRINERAGVSRGALGHHFANKAELVTAALRHLTAKIGDELLAKLSQTTTVRSDTRQFERLLDALWQVHTSTAFAAAMELWIAARTDPVLRAELLPLEREVTRLAREAVHRIFGDDTDRRHGRTQVDAALATMRGLSILRFVAEPADVDRRWRAIRAELVQALRGDAHAAA